MELFDAGMKLSARGSKRWRWAVTDDVLAATGMLGKG